MMDLNTAWQFGVALGLGLLIGLERERTRGEERIFAGARTFALVSLLGAVAVYAGEQSGLTWITVVGKSMLLDTKRGKQLANECRV